MLALCAWWWGVRRRASWWSCLSAASKNTTTDRPPPQLMRESMTKKRYSSICRFQSPRRRPGRRRSRKLWAQPEKAALAAREAGKMALEHLRPQLRLPLRGGSLHAGQSRVAPRRAQPLRRLVHEAAGAGLVDQRAHHQRGVLLHLLRDDVLNRLAEPLHRGGDALSRQGAAPARRRLRPGTRERGDGLGAGAARRVRGESLQKNGIFPRARSATPSGSRRLGTGSARDRKGGGGRSCSNSCSAARGRPRRAAAEQARCRLGARQRERRRGSARRCRARPASVQACALPQRPWRAAAAFLRWEACILRGIQVTLARRRRRQVLRAPASRARATLANWLCPRD